MYADFTIKAHCYDTDTAQAILMEHSAEYKGLDVQTDTFYEVDEGMLKLREGNLEHVLIHYSRTRLQQGCFRTDVSLYLKNPSAGAVKELYGDINVLAQVKKLRKIFFIDNVKFHLDQVENLGHFIEIEAIDLTGVLGTERLKEQLHYYKDLLQIEEEDIVHDSYVAL